MSSRVPQLNSLVCLAFAVLSTVAFAACGRPKRRGAETQAGYLALRSQYETTLTARVEKEGKAALPAESLARRDLERHLRPLIGSFSMKGIADSGSINLASLFLGDEDNGLADGLLYHSADRKTRFFVTTPASFARGLQLASMEIRPLLAIPCRPSLSNESTRGYSGTTPRWFVMRICR